jgi:hypothetical protein
VGLDFRSLIEIDLMVLMILFELVVDRTRMKGEVMMLGEE